MSTAQAQNIPRLWGPAYGVSREWQRLCPHRTYRLYTAASGKAMFKCIGYILTVCCTQKELEWSNHLSPLRRTTAGVKSMLMNERWRQACQQPLQRTSKSCSWLAPLPEVKVKVQPAQSPAEESQAKTRSQHKHHLERGKCRCNLTCWLHAGNVFRVFFHRYVLWETLL